MLAEKNHVHIFWKNPNPKVKRLTLLFWFENYKIYVKHLSYL